MLIPGQDRHRSASVGNRHLGAIIGEGPHIHFITARFTVRICQPSSIRREGRERKGSRHFEKDLRLSRPHLAGPTLHSHDSNFAPPPRIHFPTAYPPTLPP